jgi:hypothetical protein
MLPKASDHSVHVYDLYHYTPFQRQRQKVYSAGYRSFQLSWALVRCASVKGYSTNLPDYCSWPLLQVPTGDGRYEALILTEAIPHLLAYGSHGPEGTVMARALRTFTAGEQLITCWPA